MLPEAQNTDITPVILAGGKGRRLWPLTNEDRPKPFLKIRGGKRLLQATLERLKTFAPPILICDKQSQDKASAILPVGGLIITEPQARSTAAAITLAALRLKGGDGLMLVTPSDHVVRDDAVFTAAVERASARALGEDIVLLGVKPRSDKTRYGYICAGGQMESGAYDVQHFVEKPQPARARSLIASINCFWNTGIFLCRPDVFLTEMGEHAPEILHHVETAMIHAQQENGIVMPQENAYTHAPKIPVDYALMEKSDRIAVTPLETPWQDVGNWPAYLRARFYSI